MVQMLTRLADLIDELDGLQGASMDVETAYTQLDEVVRLLKQDATGMDPKMVAHLIDIAQRPDLAWLDDYIASVT